MCLIGLVIIISHESPKLRDERYLLNCERSMWLANFIKYVKKTLGNQWAWNCNGYIFKKNKFEGLPKLKWYVEINIFLKNNLDKILYYILSFHFIACYLKE
jgi:hypothetical protein